MSGSRDELPFLKKNRFSEKQLAANLATILIALLQTLTA